MIKAYIIATLTADGIIARGANQAATWSSKEDKKFFVEKTKQTGVIVMGLNTFKTIARPLPGRLNIVYTELPAPHPEVEATTLPPDQLLAELEKRGFKEVAICGGTTIYTMFLRAGVVDKLYLSIEPKLFGKGLNLFNQDLDLNLKLLSTQQLNPDVVLLEYQITK